MPAALTPETVVGVSISATPDLRSLGLGEIHVRHAFIEIVRHILSAGGSVAYGGDLRRSGYTHAIFDLVRTYNNRPGSVGPERFRSYLAWHIFDSTSAADRAAAKRVATLVRVAPPEDAPSTLAPTDTRDAVERRWAAASLTAMRARMAQEVTGQIVLGGRTSGQTGIVPGIAEEAAHALRAGRPLYPIGGFGGGGHLVAEVFRGSAPPEFTLEYQLEAGDQQFRDMVTLIGLDAARSVLDGVVSTLSTAGWPHLANGLSAEENEHLIETADVEQIVILVVRGLRNL